ncbi:MAG TPA: hypothetical protein VEJ67_07310 [Candidatus Cybelea sp.]|nr:hypothetical protein [Candidatus Cybelea sp.]
MRRKFTERNDWQKRVDPVFVRYWSATKKLALVGRKNRAEKKKAFDELSAASRLMPTAPPKAQNSISARVWAEILRPLDGETWPHGGEPGKAYAVNPEACAFFRDLVFLQLGISYRELITQAEEDSNAHRLLLRIHHDYYRFRWECGFEGLRLKFNLNHFRIILQGLDYGLNRLNEMELASCFNEICPCAQAHSGEYLKKLRVRVKRACEHLIESTNKPTSIGI